MPLLTLETHSAVQTCQLPHIRDLTRRRYSPHLRINFFKLDNRNSKKEKENKTWQSK